MAKKYEKDFKLMIVGLLQSGQTAVQVCRDYGLKESMIRRWRKEKEHDKEAFTGKGNISLSPTEKKIMLLENELQEVKLERDILKKAVGIFSKTDRRSMSS